MHKQQHIDGDHNQQLGNNSTVININADKRDAVVTEAQAFKLRKLVIELNESYQEIKTFDHKMAIWNELHDYCQTPAPADGERRSRYRLIPQSQYYRAIAFLTTKLLNHECKMSHDDLALIEQLNSEINQLKQTINNLRKPLSFWQWLKQRLFKDK
jgi:hypothetical protein